jgi:hypothetical protein
MNRHALKVRLPEYSAVLSNGLNWAEPYGTDSLKSSPVMLFSLITEEQSATSSRQRTLNCRVSPQLVRIMHLLNHDQPDEGMHYLVGARIVGQNTDSLHHPRSRVNHVLSGVGAVIIMQPMAFSPSGNSDYVFLCPHTSQNHYNTQLMVSGAL